MPSCVTAGASIRDVARPAGSGPGVGDRLVEMGDAGIINKAVSRKGRSLKSLNKKSMIKVFLADSHPIVREGIKHIINEMCHNISVIGEASNGRDVLTAALKEPADVYVMEIKLPSLNGFETARRIKKMDSNSKIIFLTGLDEKGLAEKAFEMGVSGYITKGNKVEDIVRAIQRVCCDQYFFSGDILKNILPKKRNSNNFQKIISKMSKLTPREKEIVKLIGEGLTCREIADCLHVSHSTICVHKKNIMHKLDIHREAQIVRYAIKEGLAAL